MEVVEEQFELVQIIIMLAESVHIIDLIAPNMRRVLDKFPIESHRAIEGKRIKSLNEALAWLDLLTNPVFEDIGDALWFDVMFQNASDYLLCMLPVDKYKEELVKRNIDLPRYIFANNIG